MTTFLHLRLVRLPAYSPVYYADKAVWGGIREEVTAHTCFGTAARIRATVDTFSHGVANGAAEVKQRCRTILQASAEALDESLQACHADPVAA